MLDRRNTFKPNSRVRKMDQIDPKCKNHIR